MTSERESMLINGQATELLSVADRGLHYGDGLFETCAVRDGAVQLWETHLARLYRGCERLGIPCPGREALAAEAQRVCAGFEHCVLKIIVTRGVGGRGYRAPQPAEPTRIVARYPWPSYPASFQHEGVVARLCRTRLGINPDLAGLKHLNRLEQVLARSEWQDPDIAEGVMLDAAGYAICGTMSNLFVIKDGVLHTPELSTCGVAGIMRAQVLELAHELGIGVDLRAMTPVELEQADGLFFSNCLIGLWPVRRFQERTYELGPFMRHLTSALHRKLSI